MCSLFFLTLTLNRTSASAKKSTCCCRHTTIPFSSLHKGSVNARSRDVFCSTQKTAPHTESIPSIYGTCSVYLNLNLITKKVILFNDSISGIVLFIDIRHIRTTLCIQLEERIENKTFRKKKRKKMEPLNFVLYR